MKDGKPDKIIFFKCWTKTAHIDGVDTLAFYDALFAYAFDGEDKESELDEKTAYHWRLVRPLIGSKNMKELISRYMKGGSAE